MDFFNQLFFAEGKDLNIITVAFRALLVFTSAFIIIRIAKKRFLGKNTAFDIVLGIILGSVLSRAVNGSAKFFPSLSASIVIVLLHMFLSYLVAKNEKIAKIIEGTPKPLIKDGVILKSQLEKHFITEKDILESARSNANLFEKENIVESMLENNGKISIKKKE